MFQLELNTLPCNKSYCLHHSHLPCELLRPESPLCSILTCLWWLCTLVKLLSGRCKSGQRHLLLPGGIDVPSSFALQPLEEAANPVGNF